MTTLTLQLEQASSDFRLTDAQAFSDYLADLDHEADVVGFTEVHTRHRLLHAACDEQGYQLHMPPSGKGDVALAVRNVHRIVAAGAVPSIPGARPSVAHGVGHTARPILWVTFQPHGTTENVTVHEAHWVTKRADTGGQQLQLTQDMAAVVASHSGGARLGFWMGDTNSPDRPRAVTAVDRALMKGDLTSCWDELGRYPNTHGGNTLDVVGSYDPDRRVTCLRARRWHKLDSDHIAVSAWYQIRRPQLRPPVQGD